MWENGKVADETETRKRGLSILKGLLRFDVAGSLRGPSVGFVYCYYKE